MLNKSYFTRDWYKKKKNPDRKKKKKGCLYIFQTSLGNFLSVEKWSRIHLFCALQEHVHLSEKEETRRCWGSSDGFTRDAKGAFKPRLRRSHALRIGMSAWHPKMLPKWLFEQLDLQRARPQERGLCGPLCVAAHHRNCLFLCAVGPGGGSCPVGRLVPLCEVLFGLEDFFFNPFFSLFSCFTLCSG